MSSGASGARDAVQLEDHPPLSRSELQSDAGTADQTRGGASADGAVIAQVHPPTITQTLGNENRGAGREIESTSPPILACGSEDRT